MEKTARAALVSRLLGTDSRENCRIIVAQALEILEADLCLYLPPDVKDPPCTAGQDLAKPTLTLFSRFSADLLRAAATRQPVCYEKNELPDELARALGVEALAGLKVPVGTGDGGVLWAGFSAHGPFSADDAAAMQSLAHALGFQERLKRADRIKRMGSLARQMAHDLNNILSGLVSYPELILMQLDPKSSLRDPIAFMHESGLQAADLVKDFLILARPLDKQMMIPTPPAQAVDTFFNSSAYSFLTTEFPGIRISCHTDPHLPDILAIEEFVPKLMNVLIRHGAQNLNGQGQVKVFLTRKTAPPKKRGGQPVIGVLLTVEDQGAKISPEDRARFFEPFYAKKIMNRKGSGLGLSVIRKLIHDQGGDIRFNDMEIPGNRMEVFLPPAP